MLRLNSEPQSWLRLIFCLVLMLLVSPSLLAADWPMWRYDAYRSAASPEELPDTLQLAWVRQYTQRKQVWDDPLNHDLMPYDRIFEPVIMDGRMFVSFNDRDKVVALDLDSGSMVWEFYTDGPVRFPPAACDGKVFFTSDDGYLYCVGADNGQLLWRFRGGPSDRKVIGNERVISAWPARGGPVIRDRHVYFAASIWPFMGTFIYALEMQTGEVVWVNDSTSAQYIKQPHGAPSFAGVAPQGALVATKNVLLVPGGRSVPAALDRSSGQFMHFGIGGKGTGGSFVCADEQNFYVHTRVRGVRACELQSGKPLEQQPNEPVLTDGGTISFDGTVLHAKTKAMDFSVQVDASGDVIQAGSRIYVAGKDKITALNHDGTILWSQPVEGQVLRLLAGGDKLVAVTLDGRILVYGEQAVSDVTMKELSEIPPVANKTRDAAAQLISRTAADQGYAIWFGVDDIELLSGVLAESDLHVVVVESDATRVDELRRLYDTQGQYGHRITVHLGDPDAYKAPPYVANLIVVGSSTGMREKLPGFLVTIYESVRPYGGALWFSAPNGNTQDVLELVHHNKLAKANTREYENGVLVIREGSLEGAADWTHQYGDIANTVKSNDRRVRLPLGVLWFGGSSNMDMLPRHSHGPPEQVVGGRTFVEGMDSISARDTYTGRVLWKRTLENLNHLGIYFDHTYENTPLSTKYNQVHIPGANGRGTNFVATDEEIYVVVGSHCKVLDATTGDTIRQIDMPSQGPDSASPLWGFIGIYENILLGGKGFANYSGQPRDLSTRQGLEILDMSASDGLVAFDRDTGRVVWETDSRFSFIHNGIVAGGGRIYCLDKLPKSTEDKLRRRGVLADRKFRIVALDAQSGELLWEQEADIFGSWLSYSAQHDILLQAGALANDRLSDEIGQGMIAYQGRDGAVVWDDLQLDYSGPCMLYHDTIITNANSYQRSAGAFNLLDGTPSLITNPITGKQTPWQFTRNYGCNTVIASENLLTFRSGAAGFYDLLGSSGSGNFGGFRAGCSSNLVAAGGVLNAPDYTRTCTCSYQNQTSLALVHMPDLEIWTNSVYSVEDRVRRLGINFGAPGDRRSNNGTLWLDHPSVGGDSPEITVQVKGDAPAYFRRHTSAIQNGDLPWVAASGVQLVHSISVRVTPDHLDDTSANVIPLAAGHDDAEERSDGSMYLDSSDLELVEDNSPQMVGLRFTDIQLKPGEEVMDARIHFTVDEESSGPTKLQIHSEAADNAERFNDKKYNISARHRSKAAVSWVPEAWPKVGASTTDQQTPNLASLVNEAIQRPGWKSGNAIAFMISGVGARTACSYENHATKAARLTITPASQVAEKQEAPAPAYTVKLFFAEPLDVGQGERVFDVALQDRTVLHDFDIAKQTGGPLQSIVKQFSHIPIADELTISLTPQSDSQHGPLLNGVELIAE
ncbi:MAG: PQQ-binding-like beta-propeller repeat protein [Pirellulaceae bacterium]|nr:PQQ-binding-like beta-propeller repeat protein [Pirellulaceae bacterium]